MFWRVMLGGAHSPAVDIADVYDRTAPVYDRFTAHHDFELWLGNLLPALEREGLVRGRLLDIGCGTGKSFMPMLERGWSVTAVDASERMLDVARSKAGDRAEYHAADLRQLPSLGQFDLVWCLGDVINYMLTTDELVSGLSALARNLRPHGLCVFDANTVATYRGLFASTETIEMGDRRVVWTGHETENFTSGGLASATLEVESGAGTERAEHRQRHYISAHLHGALRDAGLELVALYGITTEAVLEQPLDELRHTKAVFVSRRARRR